MEKATFYEFINDELPKRDIVKKLALTLLGDVPGSEEVMSVFEMRYRGSNSTGFFNGQIVGF